MAINNSQLIQEISRLRAANKSLLTALKEIAKGEGRYSMDPLEHAGNTVEDMKELANAAISAVASTTSGG